MLNIYTILGIILIALGSYSIHYGTKIDNDKSTKEIIDLVEETKQPKVNVEDSTLIKVIL